MKATGCRLEGRNGHDAAWALLRKLYSEETGQPLPPVLRTNTGCPYFENSPYFFSLTHTRNHAFCVLSLSRVGIDAEELTRIVRPQLAERILSPWEKAQFDAAADKNRALLTFWVLKEASAKCSGTGLQGMPMHTHFDLNDPRVSERDGCLVAIVEESRKNHAF